jgi:Gpi18-like mannosyltransferase
MPLVNKIAKLIAPHAIWVLLTLGLAVRFILFATVDFMFANDVRTFQIWGSQLASGGLSNFYTGGMWSDYPPGFLYYLAFAGHLRFLFEWELLSPIFNFFIFLPSMLADVAIGYVVWRVARREVPKSPQTLKTSKTPPAAPTCDWFALAMAGLWLFNPAILLISSVWGQVESVFLLPLVLSLILLRDGKLLGAYLLYGVAILIKPQSLFLGPIYLHSAFESWRNARFASVQLKKLAIYIGAALGLMMLLALPFAQGINLMPVFRQFWGGLDMYNFGTVNAFNLWAIFGRNWQPLDATFLGLSHAVWGVVIAVAIVVGIFTAAACGGGGCAAATKSKNTSTSKNIDTPSTPNSNYWLLTAGVFLLTFVFSVKMHER